MAASVLVIGAGGLGCPVLSYLTGAGVGQIGIIDFDTVDISNLHRQVLFNSADIGKNKAQCAAKHLQDLNPLVKLEVYPEKLTTENALELFEKYDLIIDGTDNFSTRYLVNDAAVITGKPIVYGSIHKFQGQVSVFNYQDGPTYRCLFPEPPQPEAIQNCSEIGVLGVLPGIIGTQQGNEAIKIILGIGEPLRGKLLIYDALNAEYTKLTFERNPAEVAEVLNRKTTFKEYDYDLFCGVNQLNDDHEISANSFSEYLNKAGVMIVDLREEWEMPRLEGENVYVIPVSQIDRHIEDLKTAEKVILVCQTGKRSTQMKMHLETTYKMKGLFNLSGGVQMIKSTI